MKKKLIPAIFKDNLSVIANVSFVAIGIVFYCLSFKYPSKFMQLSFLGISLMVCPEFIFLLKISIIDKLFPFIIKLVSVNDKIIRQNEDLKKQNEEIILKLDKMESSFYIIVKALKEFKQTDKHI